MSSDDYGGATPSCDNGSLSKLFPQQNAFLSTHEQIPDIAPT
jgi:hypothetical protein